MLYLNTHHLKQCILTLESSLLLYQKSKPKTIENEVFRNSIVKGYELAQETAFKLIKKSLKEFGHNGKNLNYMPIKEVLRLAGTHGLMTMEELERWFLYRDNRNDTAHDYGENFALETLALIPSFLIDVRNLADIIAAKFGEKS